MGVYRYRFDSSIPKGDLEGSLVLAIVGTESLHGEAQTRLDAGHVFDAQRRTVVIDSGTAVGQDLNRLFVNFIRREFGEDAFQVERVDAVPSRQTQETIA